ncbi:MAG: hypothetical protein JSS51_10340 [Planctomycetes bacterium]|nr:hypothetical protein [Planctomycetota bacterium]
MKKMMGRGGPGGPGGRPGQQNGPNGRSSEGAVRLAFDAGSAEMTEDAFKVAASIAKQLAEQPETSVRIWGLVDMRADGAKLKVVALRDSFAVRLFGTGAKGTQLNKSEYERQLIVSYNEFLATQAATEGKPAPALVGPGTETPAPPVTEMESKLAEREPAPNELLFLLARARQDAIAKYLVEKKEVNGSRVHTVGVSPEFVGTERPSAIAQVGK